MADGLIASHGDLAELTNRVVRESKRRGLRPVVGRVEKQDEHEPVEAATLDRIVVRVVDDWLVERSCEPEPPRSKRRR